jgi:hypothetical protein
VEKTLRDHSSSLPRIRWAELFRSKIDARVRWDRWDIVSLFVSCLIVGWVFALKLQAFHQLSYSGDLFSSVQAARSWLEGKGLLHDNCFGNVLVIHTYFLLLPLGLIAKPFGAPGLLFVLAASVGASYFWATRILRLLAVNGLMAIIATGALLLAPLSVAFYQEAGHGFHVETLVPALCLMLFYFLLRRRMLPSIVTALAVISVKEDAAIAAAIVAVVAGVETWLSAADRPGRDRLNWPAAVTILISVCAVPLLLALSSSQPTTVYARHSLDRLGVVPPGSLPNPAALFMFLISNIARWLGSAVVLQWVWIMLAGTFGMIVLRAYYLPVGVFTTVVAWLVNRNDLLWAPRFFPTEALLWCITLVGFASVVRAVSCYGTSGRIVVRAAIAIVVVLAAAAQLTMVPTYARRAYLLRSISIYSSAERRQADEVFTRYRSEGKPGEPVVASPMLFRYAHDRNLFWLSRLRGRPAPIWILWDSADTYAPFQIGSTATNATSGIHMEDYAVVDRRGRFVLMRKKT